MRIAVIGAGTVGVATAFELSCEGHQVTVFERRGSIAAEASFAPAGLWGIGPLLHRVKPGLVQSWRHLQPGFQIAECLWAWQWHRAHRHATLDPNLLQLARWGRVRLQSLVQSFKLELDHADGHLLLLRSRQDAQQLAPLLDALSQAQISHKTLDPSQCLTLEPGLNPQAPLHSAIQLPQDIAGNSRQFTLMLRSAAERQGAQFCFHHELKGIDTGRSTSPRVTLTLEATPSNDTTLLGAPGERRTQTPRRQGVETLTESFDAVVLCTALGSQPLLKAAHLKLPLAALWGQSMTAPLRHLDTHPELAPRAAVTDWHTGVTISRIDSRLRVAGGSRLGAKAPESTPARWPSVVQSLDTWYPGVTRISQAQRWVGARICVPDGRPVLGASRTPGIWLNLAHGHAGVALACGTAKALTEQLSGRRSTVAITPFSPQRYGA